MQPCTDMLMIMFLCEVAEIHYVTVLQFFIHNALLYIIAFCLCMNLQYEQYGDGAVMYVYSLLWNYSPQEHNLRIKQVVMGSYCASVAMCHTNM